MRKRIFSLLLCAVLIFGLLPVRSLAVSAVPSGYTGIYTASDFNNIRKNMAGKYILMANISLSSYSAWESFGYAEATADRQEFTGILDGNGYQITGCTLNGGHDCYGLFWTNSGTIRNLKIYGTATSNGAYTAVLTGYNKGVIENCHSYVALTHTKGSSNSYMSIGGLAASNTGTIRDSSNQGAVSANPTDYGGWMESYVGGIAGRNSGTIERCWNTGAISIISTSSASFAGGITAENAPNGIIRNCYNTGKISSSSGSNTGYSSASNYGVGGIFCLGNDGSNTVSYCFNYGTLSLSASYHNKYTGPIGALGSDTKYTKCYYLDTTYTGTSSHTKLTASQMRQQSNFAGFDFSSVWAMGSSYPTLRSRCTHLVEYRAAVAASCTADGNIAHYYCNICSRYFNSSSKTTELTRSQTILPAAHTPGEAVIENQQAGDCRTPSSWDSVVYCSVCKTHEISRQQVTGDNGDHAPAEAVKENEQAGDCKTKSSYESVVYCDLCDEELSRETVYGAFGVHTPAEAVKENEQEGNCETKSSYESVIYCDLCEEELSRETVYGDFGDHAPAEAVKENETAGDCENKSSYESVVYCDLCEEELSRETVYGAFGGHTPAEAVKENEQEGNCETKSSYESVVYCDLCEDELSRETVYGAFGDHAPAEAVKENETAGDCETKSSYESVVYCDICKTHEISREKVSGAFGSHQWSDWEDGGAVLTRGCSICGAADEKENPHYEPEKPVMQNPFVDVKEGAFYYESVLWAVEEGITSGTSATTFEPNSQCTRGQVVTFLWRAQGSPEPKSLIHPFADVDENAFYYKAMLWAVEEGITAGTSATTFAPGEVCTRGQVVTFLWRAVGSPAVSNANNPFADTSATAFYYTPMLWAVEAGVTSGTTATTFAPSDPCTRGQVVTFLYRAVEE